MKKPLILEYIMKRVIVPTTPVITKRKFLKLATMLIYDYRYFAHSFIPPVTIADSLVILNAPLPSLTVPSYSTIPSNVSDDPS